MSSEIVPNNTKLVDTRCETTIDKVKDNISCIDDELLEKIFIEYENYCKIIAEGGSKDSIKRDEENMLFCSSELILFSIINLLLIENKYNKVNNLLDRMYDITNSTGNIGSKGKLEGMKNALQYIIALANPKLDNDSFLLTQIKNKLSEGEFKYVIKIVISINMFYVEIPDKEYLSGILKKFSSIISAFSESLELEQKFNKYLSEGENIKALKIAFSIRNIYDLLFDLEKSEKWLRLVGKSFIVSD